VRDTADAGRLSYSRTRRRSSISVPLACSTTHLFATGTNPGPVNEIHRLINVLLIRPTRSIAYRLRWSNWRRRH
jgi:hypothetical protein